MPLTPQIGGTGWSEAWTVDGKSCQIVSPGLQWQDAAGFSLSTSGLSVSTSGSATTQSFRKMAQTVDADVWISFLWKNAVAEPVVKGVTFYLDESARFTVRASTVSPSIILSNASSDVSSNQGVFNTTHLVVLRLRRGVGTGGKDRLDLFVDPRLTGAEPSTPDTSVERDDFRFNRIRISGHNGKEIRFDELRIATTYAGVTPHSSLPNTDIDGDGVGSLDEQKLGTDPNQSDATLFTAIRQHPEFFGFFGMDAAQPQVLLDGIPSEELSFYYDVQHSSDLKIWNVEQSVLSKVTLPEGKTLLHVRTNQQGPQTSAADTDGDTLTDARETLLGMDPNVSDAAFILAVKTNPKLFNFHDPSDVHQLILSTDQINATGETGELTVTLEGPVVGAISNTQPIALPGGKHFFRGSLKGPASQMATRLAAGLDHKLVVYGTSLTAAGAWPMEINTWMNQKYPGQLTVINSGMSGLSSYHGVRSLQTRVIDHQPDTVIIEFSMNDAFRYTNGTPPLSPAQAKANLNSMIDTILANKADTEIILQTMNPAWDVAPNGTSATKRPNLSDFYKAYREVAAERGLHLIDHYLNWLVLQQSDPASFRAAIPDGTHPSAAGQRQYIVPLLKWRLSGSN